MVPLLFFKKIIYIFVKNFKNMREINVLTELESVINGTKDKMIVVDCYAPWCGPCRSLGEMFSTLTEDELVNCEIIKVNVDEADDFAYKYSIRSVPTLLYFRNGEFVNRTIGVLTKEDFLKKINDLMDE